MDKPQIIFHAEKSLNFTPFDVRWIPCSCRCVVLGATSRNTGAIKVFSLEDGQFQLTSEFEKPKAFKCGSFGAATHEERHLATGNFDGYLQIWDLENTHVPVYEAKAHREIINCLDGVGGGISGNFGAPEIVTGSKDGFVKVWDTRQKDTPVACMQPDVGQQHRDCWTVAFGNTYNDQERCVCAGYDNGDLKLFDLRAMAVKWETTLKNGICSVEFDRKTIPMNKLVVTTLESMFHVFDMRVTNDKCGFASKQQKAHKSTVWFVRHLPQNRDIFMTGGGNGSVNLWKYTYGDKRANPTNKDKDVGTITNCQQLDVTSQPIPAFDWNSDFQGLCVCTSFDQMLRALIVTKLKTL